MDTITKEQAQEIINLLKEIKDLINRDIVVTQRKANIGEVRIVPFGLPGQPFEPKTYC